MTSGSFALKHISAVTLATHDMGQAVNFYCKLGFVIGHGGEKAEFTSFTLGENHLNLILQPPQQSWSWWGRVIFYVSDVDIFYERALTQGLQPAFEPCDAEWGERYFHISDPDGHELSFAKPL